MTFDLSIFPQIGKWLFDTAVSVYKAIEFDFGGFTINGWVLIISVAVACLVIWLLGRILS